MLYSLLEFLRKESWLNGCGWVGARKMERGGDARKME